MNQTAQPTTLDELPSGGSPVAVAPQEDDAVSRQLAKLVTAAAEDGLLQWDSSHSERRHQNQLAHALLGAASGLFASLRAKHPPSANHSLRVALTCSGWAEALGLPDEVRDHLEAAALLHDLGKLGVPDYVLNKPGRLSADEQSLMGAHPHHAADILVSFGAPLEIIEIILTAGAWYDGSNKQIPLAGEQIPLAARLLSIVDAYDSITTDHVYRPGRPREVAVSELFSFSERQFDPLLVESFADLLSQDQGIVAGRVASRWLSELAGTRGGMGPAPDAATRHLPGDRRLDAQYGMFERKLVTNMHDGVVFVDAARRIFQWNTGAERLTGVSGAAAADRVFEPSLLQLSQANGTQIPDDKCPVLMALQSGNFHSERVGMLGRSGRHVTIDLQVFPVFSDVGVPCGATVLMHDVSSEKTLEERCMALHAQATRDPLTQVANRAEFDRMLSLFIDAHQETGLPCSLIMSDIDNFKKINDTFGHQAGDEAIVTFATLLKSLCRTGDLVARYGGEEFAVLCADCNNATAALRAEEMRQKLANTAHASLANHLFTASFGVTELQAGDTPETMIRRADRALLQAKDQGRNQVVQLGAGMMEEKVKRSWFRFRPWSGTSLIETRLSTNVPIELAIQKLRGFISDRAAKVLRVTDSEVRLEVDERAVGKAQQNESPVTYVVEIKFGQQREMRSNTAGFAAGEYVATIADVTIRPKRDRDRNKGYVTERARMLFGSLKSYLMARETPLQPVADPA